MESQNEEWKRKWDEKFLKQICGLANSDGGVMKIGIDDDGTVVGVSDPKSVVKNITDTIVNKLGLFPTIEVDKQTSVITIIVPKASVPITLDGNIYVRTGNTTHAAEGREFDHLMMKRMNIVWTDMPIEGLDMSCLDSRAIQFFREKIAIKSIISRESLDLSDQDLLMKLKLMTREGDLTRAAVLLFHPHPEDVVRGSSVKVGLFEGTDGSETVYSDFIDAPLIYVPDLLYDLISTKYTMRRISYNKMSMKETRPYPDESLREAIINAVMHKDYGSSMPIVIRIWDDKLRIDNRGGMPADWSYEDLFKPHQSVQTNPGIAYTFFLAGLVEGWGRGIKRIMDGYEGYPGKEPEFDVDHASFTVTLKNINYDLDKVRPEAPEGLSPDIEKMLRYMDVDRGRSAQEVSDMLGVSRSNVVSRKIVPLIELGLVERTDPSSLTSKNQRYRTTRAGSKLLSRTK